MFKKVLFSIIFIISLPYVLSAQYNFAQEIGITIGPATFQTDFGERNDFETNSGNAGVSFGLLHYFNFSSGSYFSSYFNEHIRVRSELSFNTTNLRHFGKWVNSDSNSLGQEQLQAMRGASTVLNLGIQGELNFIKIHSFENSIGSFGPYVSLGLAYSYYNSKITSTLGTMGEIDITHPKYLPPSNGRTNGFSSESKTVLSFTTGFGTRYKLTKMSDLLVDMRFQSFTSDWVDGLNPNKQLYKENKSNDWMVWFNFGYIHYLEF